MTFTEVARSQELYVVQCESHSHIHLTSGGATPYLTLHSLLCDTPTYTLPTYYVMLRITFTFRNYVVLRFGPAACVTLSITLRYVVGGP